MMEDFDTKHWETSCPKYDCRKDSCKCGLKKVVLPASLGDDSDDSPIAPKNGAYCNALVTYEDNGHTYIYSQEGVPTLIDVDAKNIDTFEEELRDEARTRANTDNDLNERIDDLSDDFIYKFDTVADMKASTRLVNGSYARTGGFHSVNDGGGALYKIGNVGPANEMDVIAVGNLYATIVTDSICTPEMFGAYGDNTHDDTASLQRAIDLSSHLLLTNSYKINYITIHDGLVLEGKDDASVTSLIGHWLVYHSDTVNPVSDIKISGISFIGHGDYVGTSMGADVTKDAGIVIGSGKNITIDNCQFTDFGEVCIKVFNTTDAYITKNIIKSTLDYSSGGAIPNYSFGIQVDGDGIHVEDNNITGYIQGIINDANTDNLFISGNLISQRYQHGIYLSSGDNIVIEDNVINGQAGSLCGIKLQCNVAEHRIYNANITGNIIKTSNTDGAHGILCTSFQLAPYPIDKIVINDNIILGVRGINVENIENCLIQNNLIDSYDTNSSYGIYANTSNITNGSSWYKYVISDNKITSSRCIWTNNASSSTTNVTYNITGNDCYTPDTTGVTARQSIHIEKVRYAILKDNMLDCVTSPALGQCDGIIFDVANVPSTTLLANCTKNFRWGCRNLSAYDASKITNIGNAFNTSLNIS